MKITTFDRLHENEDEIRAVALGAFDALHLGHRKLLRRTLRLGKGKAAVVTFRQNPAAVLDRENFAGELLTPDLKIRALRKMGFKELILIDFSPEFSKLSGEAFLNRLIGIHGLRYIVAGADYRCGQGGSMDVDHMKQILSHHRVNLHAMRLKMLKKRKISSSDIRLMVKGGQLIHASKMLGRPYRVEIPAQWQEQQLPVEIPVESFHQVLPDEGRFAFSDYNGRKGLLDINMQTVRLFGYTGAVEDTIVVTNFKEKNHGDYNRAERGDH